jgi:hypothetical protein
VSRPGARQLSAIWAYLIDLDHAVIVDVEASTAVRQAEVTAARTCSSPRPHRRSPEERLRLRAFDPPPATPGLFQHNPPATDFEVAPRTRH